MGKKFDNNHSIGISKILLLFILLVASPNTNTLLSKQMKDYIDENRYVQHIIAFLMLLVVIDISYPSIEFYKLIIYSIIVYLLFLGSTKLDLHWNITIFILLFLSFIYENKIDSNEDDMLDDPYLDNDTKMDILRNNRYFKYGTMTLIVFLISLGTYFYNDRKMVQYGGSYNFMKYLFE